MSRFPLTGPLSMSTIATNLQITTRPVSMLDYGTKGIMRTWNLQGISTMIPVIGSGVSLNIDYFRGRYYRNPAIPPSTIIYTTSQTLTTAPIIDGSSPSLFTYQIVGGGGGGGSGGGGDNGDGVNLGGGGGGGGEAGGYNSGSGSYTLGNSVIITIGSGGSGGAAAGVNEDGSNGDTGGTTTFATGTFTASVSGGDGGNYGFPGSDGDFGFRGGRGGAGGTGGGGSDGQRGGDGEWDAELNYAGGGAGGTKGTGYIYSGLTYGSGGDGSSGGKADSVYIFPSYRRYAEGSSKGGDGSTGVAIITWFY